ncbi:MAG: 50S ribosomal protein L24 [Candidatus Omnitrophica bacterium]|nr:50S ribosomal protein L24 [Candidatus Omnitrophota bacterium]
MKIRKNDNVKVMAGKDKGKSGKVLSVLPKKNKALVEGINFVKRHTRKRQQDGQGGIVQKEALIHISNLQLVCPRCAKPTRVGFTILSDGKKSRICKKCEELL